MKRSPSLFDTERIFLRSCLESAPAGGVVRGFNVYGAARKSGPTRLHALKQTLLHEALEQSPDPQIQKQLCGAANLAAESVWDTNCPLLLFPCLFQEMAAAILGRREDEVHPIDPWAHPILADETVAVSLNAVET